MDLRITGTNLHVPVRGLCLSKLSLIEMIIAIALKCAVWLHGFSDPFIRFVHFTSRVYLSVLDSSSMFEWLLMSPYFSGDKRRMKVERYDDEWIKRRNQLQQSLGVAIRLEELLLKHIRADRFCTRVTNCIV